MRVHLILITFFVSTALARGARIKREDVTVLPPAIPTSETSNGYTSPDDIKNKCDRYSIFQPPLTMILEIIKSVFLNIFNLPDDMNILGLLQPDGELAAEIYQHYLKPLVPKIVSILQ